MRSLLAVLSLALVAGCSAGGGGSQEAGPSASTSAATTGASPSPSTSGSAAADDPCSLVTTTEVQGLTGSPAQAPRTGTLAGNPVCQWKGEGDTVLQVISLRASAWAASLPEAIDGVKSAGTVSDPEGLARLEKASGIIEAGGRVSDEQACGLFSDLLVIGGQPEGSDRTIRAVPSIKDPQSLNAQLCTDGRFTSLALISTAGLATPLPLEDLSAVAASAHQRSLG